MPEREPKANCDQLSRGFGRKEKERSDYSAESLEREPKANCDQLSRGFGRKEKERSDLSAESLEREPKANCDQLSRGFGRNEKERSDLCAESRFDIVRFEQQRTAVVRGKVPVSDLPTFFGAAYEQLFPALARRGVAPCGPPFAYYPPEPWDVVDVEAGVVVATEFEPDGEVVPSHLPATRAVVAVHVGPYDTLEHTYRAMVAEVEASGLEVRPIGMWEEYLTDPDSEPDVSLWRTRVMLPIED